jgi:hypothetical protein
MYEVDARGERMEIFGGFMVMMSILGLFLAVIWLIMPFVVFAIKGKQDRSLELLETMEKRLAAIEKMLIQQQPEQTPLVIQASPHADIDQSVADHTASNIQCHHVSET